METILKVEQDVWAAFLRMEVQRMLASPRPWDIEYLLHTGYDWPVDLSLKSVLLDDKFEGCFFHDADTQCSAEYFSAFFLSLTAAIPSWLVLVYFTDGVASDQIHAVCLTHAGPVFDATLPVSQTLIHEFEQICRLHVMSRSKSAKAIEKLSSSLIEPLAAVLAKYDWIVIIHSGETRGVPVHALNLGSCPLAFCKTVTYANSFLTMLVQTSSTKAVPTCSKPCAIVCSCPFNSTSIGGENLPNLKAAACEGCIVTEIMRDKVHVYSLQGSDLSYDTLAGLADFLDMYDKTDRLQEVIHLACHFDHDAQDPNRSSFCLSDSECVPLSLFYSDIIRESGNIRLIFLSACSTGMPKGAAGQNLTLDCLLSTRAQFIVTAHWPITDSSALVFANSFYAKYASTRDPVVSIHHAQETLAAMSQAALKDAASNLVKTHACIPSHIPFDVQNDTARSLKRSPLDVRDDIVAQQLLQQFEQCSLHEESVGMIDGDSRPKAQRLLPNLLPHHWAAYRLYCNPILSPDQVDNADEALKDPQVPFFAEVEMACTESALSALALLLQSDKAAVLLGDANTLRGDTIQWLGGGQVLKIGFPASCAAISPCGHIVLGSNEPSPVRCLGPDQLVHWSTQPISECFSLVFALDGASIFVVGRIQSSSVATGNSLTELLVLNTSDGSATMRFTEIMSSWPSEALSCLHIPCAEVGRTVLAIMDPFTHVKGRLFPVVQVRNVSDGLLLNEIGCPCKSQDMCLLTPGEFLVAGRFTIVRVNVDGETLQHVRILFDCHSIIASPDGIFAAGAGGRRIYRLSRTEFFQYTWDFKERQICFEGQQGWEQVPIPPRYQTPDAPRGYPFDSALTHRLVFVQDELGEAHRLQITCAPQDGEMVKSALTRDRSEGGAGLEEDTIERHGCFEVYEGSFSSGSVVLRISKFDMGVLSKFLDGLQGVELTDLGLDTEDSGSESAVCDSEDESEQSMAVCDPEEDDSETERVQFE